MISDELRARIAAMREQNKKNTQKWSEADRYRLANSADNRAMAVAYCELGYEIIPLCPGTKSPAIPSPHPFGSRERGRCKGECGLLGHGFHDASADAEWAERHWTYRPSDGIGLRPPPRVIVLDLDVRRDGHLHLAALEAGRDALPETSTTISGRGDGGYHRWFDNVPVPVRTTLCPGVDILCHERNAVPVPPSLHPLTLKPYTFSEPILDIADATAWLIEECAAPEPPPRPPRPSRTPAGTWPRLSPAQQLRRCRGLIDTVTNADEGNRHNALGWAARCAAEDGFLIEQDDPIWCEFAEAAGAAGLGSDETHRLLCYAVAIADQEG